MSNLNPSDFGKVAVFCGGTSHERGISLKSGAAVAEGLQQSGVDAVLVDTEKRDFDLSQFDRVFIALHGRDGEDGKIQSLLEYYGIPYTGSGVTASALSMNKWYTKAVWQSVGIKSPAYHVIGDGLEPDLTCIEYPVYVKPANEGSSIGISYVQEPDDLDMAISRASVYDNMVLIEQAIQGKEYTFSFIDGVSNMPLIGLEPASAFYDYEAKYIRDDTKYIVDPPLDPALTKQCIKSSMLAYKSLSLSGWGRVDFIIDDDNEIWFIEVNSVPGMTNHSLVPMSAGATGLSFSETCLEILRGTLK